MVAIFNPGLEFPAPSKALLLREIKSIACAVGKAPSFFNDKTQPIANVKTEYAYMAPGTGAPGFSLNPLRNRLADSGVNAITWGDLRVNWGPTIWSIPREVRAIRKRVEEAQGPITYIGHSLGGLYGLFLARSLPPGQIKHTISLGSPGELGVEGAGTSTNVGPAIKFMQAMKPVYQERLINHWRPERELVPLEGIQRTSIIAIRDGVVNSLACELPDQPGCKNFYVDCNHLELITDETVAELVAHLTIHGNQVELPPELAAKLCSREDIFKYKDELVALPDPKIVVPLIDPQNPVDDLHNEPNGFEVVGRFIGSVAGPVCDIVTKPLLGNGRAIKNAAPRPVFGEDIRLSSSATSQADVSQTTISL